MTLLIGCGAIVGIVAAMVVVISQQVVRNPVVDEEALAREAQEVAARRFDPNQPRVPALSELKSTKAVPVVPSAYGSASAPSMSLSEAAAVPPPVSPGMAGIENIDDKRTAIAQTLEKFFSAPTLEARMEMVRDPRRVKPLMLSYYAREPMPRSKWRELGKAVRVDEPGFRFGYVQALFEDSPPASLIIEELADGRFLVDWECMVRYGEVSWADFLRMKPVEPKLLRVIASKAADGAISGGSQWLELRHPGEAGSVLGYFDRTDPKFATLVQQLEQGHWKDVPVTLRLCFPINESQTATSGVHIASVEGKGWLILNRP